MAISRFVRNFKEQLEFIAASCSNYDLGRESEAKRVAHALRIVFHQSPKSTSLARHLNMEAFEVLSSPPRAFAEYTAFVKLEVNLASQTPVRAIPMLGDSFQPLPLFSWWNAETVFSDGTRKYTRRQLVLAASNKDGGSHVDTNLEPFYAELASGVRIMGLDGRDLQYAGDAPFNRREIQNPQNVHLAMIRQFGHEVLVTAKHYDWLRKLAM